MIETLFPGGRLFRRHRTGSALVSGETLASSAGHKDVGLPGSIDLFIRIMFTHCYALRITAGAPLLHSRAVHRRSR